jgi:basic amino acid/polyamine antiporter, APA family
MAKEKILSLSGEPIKRSLGVLDMFSIGYGDLGSSIYYALGITALYALGATPIALGLAGIVFVCTALTYAEMASCFKDSGGSASFARHAFNDLISFIAGWGLLLDYIVTIAISAFSIGPYLAYFIPELTETSFQIGLTCGFIGILFLLNLIGIKESTRVSLILTLSVLVTQTVIIAIVAFTSLDLAEFFSGLKINSGGPDSPTWPQFFKGTAMAMVAYTGIESIAQLGAEAKRPQKNVPKAIILAFYVLIAMYLCLSVVALSVLNPHELATTYQEDPVAGIVAKLPYASKMLGPWLGLLAASLLFVAANAGLIGASRLSFNLGEYYQLPRFFYKLNHRFKTPQNALIFFAVLSMIVVIASKGSLTFLADLYNFGAMIAFTSAHCSLLAIRYKNPEMDRPFRIPLNITFRGKSYPITAIIGVICTFSVLVLVIITKPYGRNLGITWMAAGICLYLYYRRYKKIKASGTVAIEKVPAPSFKKLKIGTIVVLIEKEDTFNNLMKIAFDTALNHKSDIFVAYTLDIPYLAPIDTKMIIMQDSKFKSWQALAESQNIELKYQTIRARNLNSAVCDLMDECHGDLLITAEAPKELLLKLKQLSKKVWICS